MPQATTTDQYVLLPMRGLRAGDSGATMQASELLRSLGQGTHAVTSAGREVDLLVVDQIGADGARLVEVAPDAVAAIRGLEPGLRLVPVVYYAPATKRHARAVMAPERSAVAGAITLHVVSGEGGAPVADAIVVAFTNYAAGAGAQGVTDSEGRVALQLGGSSVKLDRLYVYPVAALWSLVQRAPTVHDGMEVKLRPLELDDTDGLRHYYANAPQDAGAEVTVAVIDTGVDPHPDLVVDGGANTVPGEDPDDFASNGMLHGTHVAGIIAARGTPPSGVGGVSPGVTLRSYRVFARGSGLASSFAIAKAIDQAVTDGCDLINMSLGGGAPDPVLRAAVEDARAAGRVCIIAAGNDGQAQVNFPAAEDMAVAVGALGRKGTFPQDSAAIDDVRPPFGTDEADFVAAFSNTGPELDLIGPGVGIISTVPGGYAEISGTSMACPAVTGVAARIVASIDSLAEKGDPARSAAIVKALLASTRDLGFPPVMEGHGLPEPG